MKTLSKKQSRSFWKQHVQTWEESGITQAAYCKAHELQIKRFGYWKRKFIGTESQSSQSSHFVQIKPVVPSQLIETMGSKTTLSIQLPNQFRIEGVTQHNLSLIKQLAEVLQ